MFEFVKRKQQRQQEQKATAAENIRRLAGILSRTGDLSDADGELLEQSAAEVGLPLTGERPSIEHLAETIRNQREQKVVADAYASLDTATTEAHDAAREYAAETERQVQQLIDKRKPQLDKLTTAAYAATQKRDEAAARRSELTITIATLKDYDALIAGDASPEDVAGKWDARERSIEARAEQIRYGLGSNNAAALAVAHEARQVENESRENEMAAAEAQ